MTSARLPTSLPSSCLPLTKEEEKNEESSTQLLPSRRHGPRGKATRLLWYLLFRDASSFLAEGRAIYKSTANSPSPPESTRVSKDSRDAGEENGGEDIDKIQVGVKGAEKETGQEEEKDGGGVKSEWDSYFSRHFSLLPLSMYSDRLRQHPLAKSISDKGSVNLLKVVLSHSAPFLSYSIPVMLLNDGVVSGLQMLVLQRFLASLAQGGGTEAWLCVFFALLLYVISSFVFSHIQAVTNAYKTRTKALLMGSVYRKALRTHSTGVKVTEDGKGGGKKKSGKKKKGKKVISEKDESNKREGDDLGMSDTEAEERSDHSSKGEVVNLMSVDADKVAWVFAYLPFVASMPLKVVVGFSILLATLGVSAIGGVIILAAVMPIHYFLSRAYGQARQRMMKWKDRRVQKVREVIAAIRTVKWGCLEETKAKQIAKSRREELKSIMKAGAMTSIMDGMFTAMPPAVLLACIVPAVTNTSLRAMITPANLFTAITVLSILQIPLIVFPFLVSSLIEAAVSCRRLGEYFQQDEVVEAQIGSAGSKEQLSVEVQHATFQWSADKREESAQDRQDENGDEEEGQIGGWNVDEIRDEENLLGRSPSSTKKRGRGKKKGGKEDHISSAKDDMTLAPRFRLGPLSLTFIPHTMTGVYGPVGAGKSSLLSSLLGEMYSSASTPRSSGEEHTNPWVIKCADGVKMAYCSQAAWLQSMSVRDNIVMFASHGQGIDEGKYKKVVNACGLDDDIRLFSNGSDTMVGERGVTLSGGQKQRIALARALYCQPDVDVYVFDDVLSAVDPPLAKSIFKRGIRRLISKEEEHPRIGVMCTHNPALFHHFDRILYLNGGVVTMDGTPAELHANNAKEMEHLLEVAARRGGLSRTTSPADLNFEESEGDRGDGKSQATRLEEEEEEEHNYGKVSARVYKTYVREAGPIKFILSVCGILLAQVVFLLLRGGMSFYTDTISGMIAANTSLSSADFLLSAANRSAGAGVVNISSNLNEQNIWSNMWIGMVDLSSIDALSRSTLLVCSILFFVGAAMSFAGFFGVTLLGAVSASNLHRKMLKSVLNAPLRFFDDTPDGRIINRFSKDVEALDSDLGMVVAELTDLYGALSISITIACIVTPWTLLMCLPVVAGFYYVQRQFRASSRERRRMLSKANSPLFSFFGETLDGLTTIRAFKMEHAFELRMYSLIDRVSETQYLEDRAKAWATLRLMLMSSVIVVGTMVAVLINPSLSVGAAGLALSYTMSITDALRWFLDHLVHMEMSMTHTERIMYYCDSLPQESNAGKEPPSSWPQRGEVEFKGVKMRYGESLPLILRSLSFKAESGQKVGLIGRTGAGKSSIFAALLRTPPIEEGVISIDGVDIASVPLRRLRQSIAFLQQDPHLLSGTIRSTVDPRNEHTADEVWKALAHAGAEAMVKNRGGIDAKVEESGKNFSQGERQVLSMAAALIRTEAKVVLMDEPTSSIDVETEKVLLGNAMLAWEGRTLFTIAHRRETLRSFDKVCVIDKGRLMEECKPEAVIDHVDGML